MAPNINNPGGVKNDPDEIRDAVVSDATRFPGGFGYTWLMSVAGTSFSMT